MRTYAHILFALDALDPYATGSPSCSIPALRTSIYRLHLSVVDIIMFQGGSFFNISMLCCCGSSQYRSVCPCSSSLSDAETSDRFGMNFDRYCSIPINCIKASLSSGGSTCTMAPVFSSSGHSLAALGAWPLYFSSVVLSLHCFHLLFVAVLVVSDHVAQVNHPKPLDHLGCWPSHPIPQSSGPQLFETPRWQMRCQREVAWRNTDTSKCNEKVPGENLTGTSSLRPF